MTPEVIDISVLIPCLNEAENVEAIAAAVASELRAAGESYEIVFIDNGSDDGTAEIIKGLCGRDGRIRLIVNNRNFGQMRSPTYGIFQTSGRAVIGLSADFQDPPGLIGEFIRRWRAGVPIVLATRRPENTSMMLRLIRAVGYWFFARFGDYRVIPGATGFGLYDRAVVECLRAWRDPEPFFRGMLVESGFAIETIAYDRPERAGGVTKNNLATLSSFAISGLANSSKKLLRVPIYVSFILFSFGIVFVCVEIVSSFTRRQSGYTVLLLFIDFAFAILFFFIGLLGEQIRLISETIRNVPLVTEKERINFPHS